MRVQNDKGGEMSMRICNGLYLALILAAGATFAAVGKTVEVADCVAVDGKTDASAAIQRLIDENPNSTLEFSDGVYLLERPLVTPAHPRKSVAFRLSNFAVLRAAPGWAHKEAMVRLGGKDPANDIRTVGSNYSFVGGVIDGNGLADGISIDGGRETAVRQVSMKGVRVGLRIKHGANGGSSDCDISDVNIVGNGATNSIGVLVEGYDNTFTNMRIADVQTGLRLASGGNSLRNIHPLYTCGGKAYNDSVGFDDRKGGNVYYYCYSDHFGTGFVTAAGAASIFDKCFSLWYAPGVRGHRHTVFRAEGAFDSIVEDMRVGFNGRIADNAILETGAAGGRGVFRNLIGNVNEVTDPLRAHERFLGGFEGRKDKAPLLVLHLDFNTLRPKKESVVKALRLAARAGYNAILWEIEDKVRLDALGEAVHPDAFTKREFREILDEADRLGLEPIPLLQTFGHAEYVLTRGKFGAWRELPQSESCYCVSKPEVRRFLQTMVREYLDLFGGKVRNFHLGGDEAWAFGKCPVCSKRNRMELYAEHLQAVSEGLRERGVKPGIWCDMVLASSDPAETARIPRTFTIWHWDYGYDGQTKDRAHAWSGKTDVLKELGFEIVFAPSTSSWGDGPFLPRYGRHGDNVAASAAYARTEGFKGLCVTSWSCRKVPKSLQVPMWELAAKRYLNPADDAKRDLKAIWSRWFGEAKPSELRTLTDWPWELVEFDGSEVYPGVKSGKPARPGTFKKILDAQTKKDPKAVEKLMGTVASTKARIVTAVSSVRQSKGGELTPELLEGAELTLAYLEHLQARLAGTAATGAVPLERTSGYFAAEQSPWSATNAAAVVWSVVGADDALPGHARKE